MPRVSISVWSMSHRTSRGEVMPTAPFRVLIYAPRYILSYPVIGSVRDISEDSWPPTGSTDRRAGPVLPSGQGEDASGRRRAGRGDRGLPVPDRARAEDPGASAGSPVLEDPRRPPLRPARRVGDRP